ncbi:MAG: glucose 1-dehydrogenase [Thermodesulfobacteriota bacterium]|nr:glucose 1-dehydrogenase [Thermodesulfobacteriota bacterium]
MDLISMFQLTGKRAMVTGASRGIGEAVAKGFAKAGADLILVSRNLSALEKVAKEIECYGRKALPVSADIGNPEEIRGAVDSALKVFSRIDVLVNNAGISPVLKRAEEVTLKEWEEIVRVNLTGTFLFCQAVGEVMIKQGGGKIINIASVGAVVAFPRQIAYCAAKGGILQLTKVLAIDWARYNIQVNAIGPAYLETKLTKGMRESKVISEDLLRRTPMGRFGKPEEIVGAAIYLASDASSYVTGQTLFVDGGWLAL